MNSKTRITQELKELIGKANGVLYSSQNRQRTTAYLYIIFSFISLSFFGLFAIGPTLSTISNLNKQYEEGLQALKLLEEKNTALTSLSSQYLTIQPDLNLIDNAIPREPNIATLTRQLEQLTLDNNLTVQKLDTGLMEIYPARNVNTPVFSFTFSVTVLGNEQDVNEFISDIVNLDRIIGIDKLSTGEQDDVHSVSITGRAFFYRE